MKQTINVIDLENAIHTYPSHVKVYVLVGNKTYPITGVTWSSVDPTLDEISRRTLLLKVEE